MMNRILLWVMAGLIWGLPALAQDSQETSAEGTAAQTVETRSEDDDAAAEPEPARRSRLDEFIPTEEISEDSSVSFPVDI